MTSISSALRSGIDFARFIASIPPTHRPTTYEVEGSPTTVRPSSSFTIYAFTRSYWETLYEPMLVLVTEDGFAFPLDVRDLPIVHNRTPLIGEYVDRWLGRQPKHVPLHDERLNTGSYAGIAFKRRLMRVPESFLPVEHRDRLMAAVDKTYAHTTAQLSPLGTFEAAQHLSDCRIERWSLSHPSDGQRRVVTGWFDEEEHLTAIGLRWNPARRFDVPTEQVILIGNQRFTDDKARALLHMINPNQEGRYHE